MHSISKRIRLKIQTAIHPPVFEYPRSDFVSQIMPHNIVEWMSPEISFPVEIISKQRVLCKNPRILSQESSRALCTIA